MFYWIRQGLDKVTKIVYYIIIHRDLKRLGTM
jgi:hypothetical protein